MSSKVDVEFSLREPVLYCTLRGNVDLCAITVLLQHRRDVKRAGRVVVDIRSATFVDGSILDVAHELQRLAGADYVDFVASTNGRGLYVLGLLRKGGYLRKHIVYDDVDQVTR